MQNPRVLAIGSLEDSTKVGLKADTKAISFQELLVTTISTGSVRRSGVSEIEVVQATPASLHTQLHDSLVDDDIEVIKIGSMFSVESVEMLSEILQHNPHIPSVLDVEPIFKTGAAPAPELVAALTELLLPSITVLSSTVPEVKALLDAAGVEIDYPKNMEDVAIMAKTLQNLGTENVIIKREIFDETSKMTTLHFILCGSVEPVTVSSRFANPDGVTGASYSIPPVIAANIANGQDISQAVSEAFKFMEEAIKGGEYFV